MAAFSSGMPSTSVYLVLPSLRARTAASLMLSGVSKSGSPADSEITSRPLAFSSRAFVAIAMVWDGEMRLTLSEKKRAGSAPMAASLVPLAGVGIDAGLRKRRGPYAGAPSSQARNGATAGNEQAGAWVLAYRYRRAARHSASCCQGGARLQYERAASE